ncbi:DUF1450 domain-containing protein [Alicyclobacillus mengziensis]|uniref:DUF1450 domain-containing protein n=1 Tax=Alicyclobacillus mengziensis TaxID=2931921 RepID=A0A9X7VVB4_9BACL|nr:DUF1450 domain-containing protein [Alicyclobacillus mengziensis]QSO45763.1 DUF1450 domain-containing protein [Alicyclobacillus mengziensis]
MANSMSLKWCKKNLEKYSQAVYDLIVKEHPEVESEIVDCADKCGLCTDVPFAVRNNATVAARDPRGLYMKLERGFAFESKPVLPGTYEDAASKAAEEETPVTP